MTNYPHGRLNSAVAEVLRGLRGRKSMTQAELAKVVGVDQSQMSKLLRGDREWRVPQVDAAAEAFGATSLEVFEEAARLIRRQDRYDLAANKGDVEPFDDDNDGED